MAVDRRGFLGGLLIVGVTSACAGGRDDNASRAPESERGDDSTPMTAAAPAASGLDGDPFTIGVASGDPSSTSVILWTRLALEPLVAGAGMPEESIEVAFDVATDEQFENLVVSDIAHAHPELGHSVHVDLSGLDANTWYYFRFRTDQATSITGRTRTFPDSNAAPEQFKTVFASCQDLQWGHYAAWKHARQVEDLDAVIFLGDYIYETTFGDMSPEKDGARIWATPPAETLDHYRIRYAQVRLDPALRDMHAHVPWIMTFDDHEVANNYAGDFSEYDRNGPTARERRLRAYQAWYENMPVRLNLDWSDVPQGPDDFDSMPLHRSFKFGSLASIMAIETRQHADPPPCRDSAEGEIDRGALCEDAFRDDRTNLGANQEAWLHDELINSTSTWNLLANPVMMAGMNINTLEEPEYYRDMWDGYPAARKRLLDVIANNNVSNPVVLTGDWHASFVLDIVSDPMNRSDAEPLMPEFVVTAISSIVFPQDHRPANDHIRFFEPKNGFGVVTVTPDELICEFHHLDEVWDIDAPIAGINRFRVQAGAKTAEALEVVTN